VARKGARRAGRERAFQVLYGLNYTTASTREELELAFAETPDPQTIQGRGTPEDGADRFAWDLVLGVWEHRDELDETITRFSQHWRIQRIARIELTILRLALYEMVHRDDVPMKVAINEGVELAKRFGDDNSRGFVNGILDAAAKAMSK
jgi:N utilization substance protein B